MVRGALLVVAALLLTGCVTVVVPTATPVPSPSPRTFAGQSVGKQDSVSELFALAAGDYAVTWTAEPAGCFFNLVLTNETYTFAVQLTPGANDVPVPEPSPVTGVAAGTYRFVYNTQCASWTASAQQIQ